MATESRHGDRSRRPPAARSHATAIGTRAPDSARSRRPSRYWRSRSPMPARRTRSASGRSARLDARTGQPQHRRRRRGARTGARATRSRSHAERRAAAKSLFRFVLVAARSRPQACRTSARCSRPPRASRDRIGTSAPVLSDGSARRRQAVADRSQRRGVPPAHARRTPPLYLAAFWARRRWSGGRAASRGDRPCSRPRTC